LGPFEVLLRRSSTTELLRGVQPASVCLVAQGAKRVVVGDEVLEYDESAMIVCSTDVPVLSQVLRATAEKPFLCLRLTLNPDNLTPLVVKVFPEGLPLQPPRPALTLVAADSKILDAAARLVGALADPVDASTLAPLYRDEFLIRLLQSPVGAVLAQLGLSKSGSANISRVVEWMKQNYAAAVGVDELAEMAHMSVSTFHDHFRAVTSTSPLQYLKALRLHEARQLMLSTVSDAKTAGMSVGYRSQAQFSRDYSRFFGQSPVRDVTVLRTAMRSMVPVQS